MHSSRVQTPQSPHGPSRSICCVIDELVIYRRIFTVSSPRQPAVHPGHHDFAAGGLCRCHVDVFDQRPQSPHGHGVGPRGRATIL